MSSRYLGAAWFSLPYSLVHLRQSGRTSVLGSGSGYDATIHFGCVPRSLSRSPHCARCPEYRLQRNRLPEAAFQGAISQMNPRRRTTVHDLAALRLHQDGKRVLNSDTNRSSRRAKYATHDSRGNWIAQDAGGLANVKQRRSAPHLENDDGPSEPEENEDALDETQPSPSSSKGKGRAREDEEAEDEPGRKPRTRKRRRFDEDLSYLASVSTPALASSADVENSDFRGEEQQPEARRVPSSVCPYVSFTHVL